MRLIEAPSHAFDEIRERFRWNVPARCDNRARPRDTPAPLRWSRTSGATVRTRLAAHEYPREVELIDELPMTTTGKIRRIELREREFERARERHRCTRSSTYERKA